MKNYTFVHDENGKIDNILINGKPVKKSYMRGFRKAQLKPYFVLYEDPCMARNPMTGRLVRLDGLEATIYDFCMKWYRGFEKGLEDNRQLFGDMKMFLLEINPDAYYDLID